MNLIKKINIHSNYFWAIKMLNKNSLLSKVSSYANVNDILNLLNNRVSNINAASKLNDQLLFLEQEDHMFLNKTKVNDNLFKNINIKNARNLFSYKLKLNSNYANNYFVDTLDLVIYFDMDNFMVDGGFSWKFRNDWKQNFAYCNQDEQNEPLINVQAIYLNTLIKNFFEELLSKMSYSDWVHLLKEKKLNNLHELHVFTSDVYTVDDLITEWNNLLFSKYFYQYFTNKNDFKETGSNLFYFFTTLFLSYYAIVDELRKKFYYPSANYSITNNYEVNSTNNLDAVNNLANFLHNDLALINGKHKQQNRINTIAGLTRNHIFLSQPNVTYGIGINGEEDYLKKDFYVNQKDVYLCALLLLYPEMFAFNYDACEFNTYTQLVKQLDVIKEQKWLLSQEFTKKIMDCELHDNYDYSSFIRKNSTLIFYDTDIDTVERSTILRNALAITSIVLAKELTYKILHSQWKLASAYSSLHHKFLYRQIEKEVNDIKTAASLENDDPVIRDNILKYARNFDLKENITNFEKEVKDKDEFDKRQRFIEIIILGFIVASLISLIDYGNMVWSTLSCTYTTEPGWPGWVGQPNMPWALTGQGIGLTTLIVFVNTLVLIVSLIYLAIAWRKNRNIAERKDIKL